MDMPYVGPFRVVAGPDERDRYLLRDLWGRMHSHFHVSKLKAWPLKSGDVVDDDYYDIEEILDARTRDGEREYLVKWTGYANKYNSWISRKDVSPGLAADLDEYDKKHETDGGSSASAPSAPSAGDPAGGGKRPGRPKGSSNKPPPQAAQATSSDEKTAQANADRAARLAARSSAKDAQDA